MNITSFAINLPHRTDRYNHILAEVEKLNLNSFEIIEGIINEAKTCFQSHLKCIQIAKDRKLPYVLILEDDAVFTEDAFEKLEIIFKEVNELQWDMFFLGANLQAPAERLTMNLLKLNGAYAAHAYMVHERFYDTILNLPHTCEMDVHYHNLMPNHNVYMCDPMIAYQLPSHSDLQDGFRDYNQAMFNNYLRFKS
jgi:glycosyl transferase family 25